MIARSQVHKVALVLGMLVGLTLVHQADAAPFRPRPYSESSRLQAKEDCQLGGGQQFETVYHYGYGGKTATSATTTCHGGKNDGQTCEISGSGKQCTPAIMPAGGRVGDPDPGVYERL